MSLYSLLSFQRAMQYLAHKMDGWRVGETSEPLASSLVTTIASLCSFWPRFTWFCCPHWSDFPCRLRLCLPAPFSLPVLSISAWTPPANGQGYFWYFAYPPHPAPKHSSAFLKCPSFEFTSWPTTALCHTRFLLFSLNST